MWRQQHLCRHICGDCSIFVEQHWSRGSLEVIKLKYYTINNVILDGLGVLEDHIIILGVHRVKKVKNHCPWDVLASNLPGLKFTLTGLRTSTYRAFHILAFLSLRINYFYLVKKKKFPFPRLAKINCRHIITSRRIL